MRKQATKYYFDGNAALKSQSIPANPSKARIISFPVQRSEHENVSDNHRAVSIKHSHVSNRSRMALLSSEMYCSLRYEDSLGVLYHVFSRGNICALTIACVIVAAFAIAVGA